MESCSKRSFAIHIQLQDYLKKIAAIEAEETTQLQLLAMCASRSSDQLESLSFAVNQQIESFNNLNCIRVVIDDKTVILENFLEKLAYLNEQKNMIALERETELKLTVDQLNEQLSENERIDNQLSNYQDRLEGLNNNLEANKINFEQEMDSFRVVLMEMKSKIEEKCSQAQVQQKQIDEMNQKIRQIPEIDAQLEHIKKMKKLLLESNLLDHTNEDFMKELQELDEEIKDLKLELQSREEFSDALKDDPDNPIKPH